MHTWLQGNWTVVGLVVKALKLQSKHEAVAATLMRVGNGEVSRMLIALARLLARLPNQCKLLKVPKTHTHKHILRPPSITFFSR